MTFFCCSPAKINWLQGCWNNLYSGGVVHDGNHFKSEGTTAPPATLVSILMKEAGIPIRILFPDAHHKALNNRQRESVSQTLKHVPQAGDCHGVSTHHHSASSWALGNQLSHLREPTAGRCPSLCCRPSAGSAPRSFLPTVPFPPHTVLG